MDPTSQTSPINGLSLAELFSQRGVVKIEHDLDKIGLARAVAVTESFSSIADVMEKFEQGKIAILKNNEVFLSKGHKIDKIMLHDKEIKVSTQAATAEEIQGIADEVFQIRPPTTETEDSHDIDEDNDGDEVEEAREDTEQDHAVEHRHADLDQQELVQKSADADKKAAEQAAQERDRAKEVADAEAKKEASAERKAELAEFKEHKQELREEEREARFEENLNIDSNREIDDEGRHVDDKK